MRRRDGLALRAFARAPRIAARRSELSEELLPPPAAVLFGGLSQVLAAVRRQGRTGDEAGVVGSEEDDAASHLLRLAKAANRNLRQNRLFEHVLGNGQD